MNAVIINAAGKGIRTGINIPKQFVDINGYPIVYWTIKKFIDLYRFDLIVIVTLPEYTSLLQQIFSFPYIKIIEGGSSSLRSRVIGLEYIVKHYPFIEKVMFHDSVRPFLTSNLITKCLHFCDQQHPAVIPYISTVSTLKDIINLQVPGVKKDPVAILQTPETFITKDLYKAVKSVKENIDNYQTLPDLYEHNGGKCLYIDGELVNFKITSADDLKLAKCIFDGKLKY